MFSVKICLQSVNLQPSSAEGLLWAVLCGGGRCSIHVWVGHIERKSTSDPTDEKDLPLPSVTDELGLPLVGKNQTECFLTISDNRGINMEL